MTAGVGGVLGDGDGGSDGFVELFSKQGGADAVELLFEGEDYDGGIVEGGLDELGGSGALSGVGEGGVGVLAEGEVGEDDFGFNLSLGYGALSCEGLEEAQFFCRAF